MTTVLEKWNQEKVMKEVSARNEVMSSKRREELLFRRSVKSFMRTSIASVVIVGGLFTAFMLSTGVSEDEVSYKKVFFTNGTTVHTEINKANGGSVDVRKLHGFFEDKNGVSVTKVHEGYYYVPVIKK
ncbi:MULTISPECIES: hypothetical protein [Bacillus]|uniref:Uncharacterized protein n=1 Tax=Bacillus thuringiensis TaxID=1428 RepID=A0A9X7BTQ1_BACTU|nr:MULTISPECIES: hypothetical protein [Bacillus cereus group]PES55881.1 hypothetical protein CN499_05490 [Bacillus thuringiensis]PFV35806.1 hypothetical protein COK99_01935 [Bacillus thuringiensis]PGV23081.1 hypothetical protein COD93_29895 [Bacillus cereus]HDX9674186.1 hypothetical protein [Bacillus cereus]